MPEVPVGVPDSRQGDPTVRPHDNDTHGPVRTGKRRFDDEDTFSKRGHRQRLEVVDDTPAEGARWSTWDQSIPTEKGPKPYPDWLVTEAAAVDTELVIDVRGKPRRARVVKKPIYRKER